MNGVFISYVSSVDIEDEVTFTRSLVPEVEGKVVRKDGKFWIVEGLLDD